MTEINFYFLLIIVYAASLIATFITVPWLIEKMRSAWLVGIDRNKYHKPEIPEMGGVAVLLGFFVGICILFVLKLVRINILFMASVVSIVGTAFVGFMDDLIKLRQSSKAMLPFLFAVPLGTVIEDTRIKIPFLGSFEVGILIVLVVPFGVTCAANAANMLEGFNGLGAGLGIIIATTLAILSIAKNAYLALYLLVPLIGALSGFLWFNKFPARIFPGDTLTLFMGATIGCAAIIADLEFVGAVLFFPMIIEFFLKLRSNFQAKTFATSVDEEGYLKYEGKIESLTHFTMRTFKLKEWQLVGLFWLAEILVAAVILFIYFT